MCSLWKWLGIEGNPHFTYLIHTHRKNLALNGALLNTNHVDRMNSNAPMVMLILAQWILTLCNKKKLARCVPAWYSNYNVRQSSKSKAFQTPAALELWTTIPLPNQLFFMLKLVERSWSWALVPLVWALILNPYSNTNSKIIIFYL